MKLPRVSARNVWFWFTHQYRMTGPTIVRPLVFSVLEVHADSHL